MFNFFRPAATTTQINQISATEAIRRSAAGELTLMDVRSGTEITQTGKARGALHIALPTLAQQADPRNPEFHPELDPEKPVAIYCASGARANMAAQKLAGLGFRTIYNLGRLSDWTAAGGKLAR